MRQKLKTALPQHLRSYSAALLLCTVGLILVLAACQAERRKSDVELGLTPTQSIGRHIFDSQCSGCHEAYSSRPLKGPGLQGVFKRPYLKNGMPANEERVREITLHGRNNMPAFGRALTPTQVDYLLQYLKTL